MHPLIRVICLVLIAGFTASANVPFLLIAFVLLAAIYLYTSVSLSQCWRLIRRMRWFFLSILVIYFWFTPGDAFSPALANSLWFPSVEGVEQGITRVVCLVLIIASVSALLQSTGRAELFAAIYSLIAWTRFIGFSPERFAVRATLTFSSLSEIQPMIASKTEQLKSPVGIKARIASLAEATTNVFVDVYKNAAKAELTTVTLDDVEAVSIWQWLYPISLVLLFIAALQLPSVLGVE